MRRLNPKKVQEASGVNAVPAPPKHDGFATLNRGFAHTFQSGKLTLGLVVPIQSYGRAPRTDQPVQMVQLAESLGFRAVWPQEIAPTNTRPLGSRTRSGGLDFGRAMITSG